MPDGPRYSRVEPCFASPSFGRVLLSRHPQRQINIWTHPPTSVAPLTVTIIRILRRFWRFVTMRQNQDATEGMLLP
jgi:hypothetical protein